MLAATHVLVGAMVGRHRHRARSAVVRGLLSHLLADGVGHDDDAIGAVGQAALGAAALGLVGWEYGWRSIAMVGALAGSIPDAEIVLWILRGKPIPVRFLFPSHWQFHAGSPTHPYRFRVPVVPIAVELSSLAVLAGWLHRSRKPT